MPVIINEIEVLDAQPPAPAGQAQAPAQAEPAAEQLRRFIRDLEGRQRRLIAD